MEKEAKNTQKIKLQAIVLIFTIVMGICIIILLQTKDASFSLSGKPPLGERGAAPNFTLPGLDGKIVSLADYRGKVILLNIWATWCPPCVEEMPSMERLYQRLKGDGFEILAVSIDATGAEDVRPFMKKHKLSFTALIGSKAVMQRLYQTTGVPESYIIDQNGMIVDKIIGPKDWASPGIIRYFKNLLQRK